MRGLFLRPMSSQSVATSTTSAQSSAAPTGTVGFRVAVTADTYIAIGPNPTATTSSMLCRASTAGEMFGIAPGEKVAAVVGSGTGIANIAFMSA